MWCSPPHEVPRGQPASSRAGPLLSAKRVEAVHVLELKLNDSDDEQIWEHAAAHGFVVISKDDDFQNRATHRGTVQVVWVRLGNCRNKALFATFENQLPAVISALERGTSVIELWPPA
jgi:predicted nuclease of predicted toxin-antitoxin system